METIMEPSRRVIGIVIVLAGVAAGAAPVAHDPDPYAARRRRMVDEDLAREGITDPRVLEAMRRVPRHLFVKPEHVHAAYLDQALDIGHGQTISPPFVVASMTQAIDPRPTDRILEIGTGSGYQAAVLAELGAEVSTVEIVAPLGEAAAATLGRLGYDRVRVRIGDGSLGWPEHAPFDKIIVTCSPERVPQPLVDQLAEGGRLIVPLGEQYQQVLHLFEKRDGRLVDTALVPTLFVPMTGAADAERRAQADPRRPAIVNGDFERSTVETGKADGWHYQRRSRLVEGAAPEGGRFLEFENAEPGRSAHMLQGMAIDGGSVAAVDVSLRMRLVGAGPGTRPQEAAGLMLHFFGARRAYLGSGVLGPWHADVPTWAAVEGRLDVPPEATEAIVQVGLNGATGTLSLDDLRLSAVARD
ncbi:MAG: protein-L-isoaspartate(D-aspartate) O-methyltransferase [Planctomycetaceae bacterium]